MEIVSPLRTGAEGAGPNETEFQPPQPSLLPSEFATFTQFIPLPPRYLDLDVPEWALKHVFGDMNALRLQMDCKWVVEPHEVWRQVCLNGDLESMFSASVRPRKMTRVASSTVNSLFPDSSSSSDTSDQLMMDLLSY